jgi:hypothetical protein
MIHPVGSGNLPLEASDLEIVLDVDREGIQNFVGSHAERAPVRSLEALLLLSGNS